MFSEKLNYLMMITSTTNTELADALIVDQSVISRFKLGKREPAKDSNYFINIARFFSHKIIKLNIQYKLSSFMNTSDEKTLTHSIYEWLKNNENHNNNNMFFDSAYNTTYYYGNKGKQEAVILFLENLENKIDETLYLYSDENLNWMLDKTFSEKWSRLLTSVLKNGNKIKRIHYLSRDYSELVNAVFKWLPLYLTGNIEPYYIPKLRDSINRRTIFVSNNQAITSNSIENKTDNMLNLYTKEPQLLFAIKEEFNNYLNISKPLLNIQYNPAFEHENDLSEYIIDTITVNNITVKIYIKEYSEFIIIKNNTMVLSTTEPILVKAFMEYYKSNANNLF